VGGEISLGRQNRMSAPSVDDHIQDMISHEYWPTRDRLRPILKKQFINRDRNMHLRGPNDTYCSFLLQLVRRINSDGDDKLNDDQLDRIQNYMLGMDEDQITGNIPIKDDKDYKMYIDTMKKYFVPLIDMENGRYIINNTTVSQLASHRIKYPNPCPYGASCYRKNPLHFKEFQHPPQNVRRSRSASPRRSVTRNRSASPRRSASPIRNRSGGTQKRRARKTRHRRRV
jgi:hypothetical protein